MSLFRREEKREEAPACGQRSGISSIQVLGLGCASCQEQLENVKKAVKNMGLDLEVEYITDLRQIAALGVMTAPAILVNGQAISAGAVLKPGQVEKLLRQLG